MEHKTRECCEKCGGSRGAISKDKGSILVYYCVYGSCECHTDPAETFRVGGGGAHVVSDLDWEKEDWVARLFALFGYRYNDVEEIVFEEIRKAHTEGKKVGYEKAQTEMRDGDIVTPRDVSLVDKSRKAGIKEGLRIALEALPEEKVECHEFKECSDCKYVREAITHLLEQE